MNQKLQNWIGICILLLDVLLYSFLTLTLDNNISWDEGFHLLGYLKGQVLSPQISDFWLIVRNVFSFLSDDPIMQLRIIRLILGLFSLLFFTFASWKWLIIKTEQKVNLFLYGSLVMLSGIVTFQFASPTLYYDNIQSILYFVIISSFLLAESYKSIISYIFSAFCGFFLVFGIMNYMPSGLLLLGLLFLLNLFFNWGNKIRLLQNVVFVFIGFVFGAVIYHFFIHNLFEYVKGVTQSFSKIESNNVDPHSSFSLLNNVFKYLIQISKIYIPIIIFSGLFFYLLRKHKQLLIQFVIPFAVVLLIIFLFFTTITFKSPFVFVFLLIYIFSYYFLYFKRILWLENLLISFGFASFFIFLYRYSPLFNNDLILVPILLLFAYSLIYKQVKFTSIEICLIIFCLIIPVSGEFGTDLNMSRKLVFFTPIWTLLFYFLMVKSNLLLNKISTIFFVTIFVLVFIFSSFYSGLNLRYYFSDKYKTYIPTETIDSAERGRMIKVTHYTKLRINEISNILASEGYKPGNKIMIFDSNTMIAYFIGAYLPEPFVYSFNGYMGKHELLNYIIIFEAEIDQMREYCLQFNVSLDKDYSYYKMRGGGAWNPNENRLAIFCRKK